VAGEPRDDLTVDTVVTHAAVAEVSDGAGPALRLRAALARVLLTAAWRDEAGSAAEWADELGRHVLAGGPLWPLITTEDG
jgi:hypothetical protein